MIGNAQYLSSYWLEMVNLPITCPSCHRELSVKGLWTVQHQSEHGFACDQAIEQTSNRGAKTKGGWTGITQNQASISLDIVTTQTGCHSQTDNLSLWWGCLLNYRHTKTLTAHE